MSDTENTPVEAEPSVALSADDSNYSYSGRSFEYIAGRRYNNEEDVDYVLPNDDEESDRLQGQHFMLKYALQCNYHSPLKKQLEEGISVIDAGCGPATWTFDMAGTYPNSKFTGIDISFVFPESFKPDNVDFLLFNIGKDILLPENSYDYYYQRLLSGGLTDETWDNSLKNAYKLLKPGGYVELVEPNVFDFYQSGPLLKSIQQPVRALLSKKGLVPTIAFELEDRLKKAGFVNIKLIEVPLPLKHSGKIGQMGWEDYRMVLINMRPVAAFANPAFQDEAFYLETIDAIGEESVAMQTFTIAHIAYAQKPPLAE